MALFDRIKDSVSFATANASQKVSLTTEKVRINNQIQNNNKEIEKLIYQIGKQYMNQHLMEKGTEFEDLFSEIRRLKSENENSEKAIQQLYDEYNQQMISRQQELKEKQEQWEREKQETIDSEEVNGSKMNEEVMYCPICGTPNDKDSIFCVRCGAKIDTTETPSVEETSDDTRKNED